MEKRICRLTKKLLSGNNEERKPNTALLIKGFRHFSKGQDMLREVMQSLHGNPEIYAKLKEVMGELYKAHSTIDEALIKITDLTT